MIQDLLLLANIIFLESVLSVDNAAVLAIMVKDLPERQRGKALRYGLWGAYLFRGLALLAAGWLIGIWWLKLLGGAYLLYLAWGHFTPKNDTLEEAVETKDSRIYRGALRLGLNRLWATIILVEIMDLAFSVDNVFAAVALTNKMYIVIVGVCVGILLMRLVAGWFVKLIVKHPQLEGSAYLVIGLLGTKLILEAIVKKFIVGDIQLEFDWLPANFDLYFSALILIIFFTPLIYKKWK